MILEWLESLATPAPRWVRSLGFVRSSVAVRSRFLRCQEAWQSHLQKTKALILEAAARCPQHRTAVLLGAGLLHDLPLRELDDLFEQVLLVDIVHPLSTRWALREYRSIHPHFCDVTGVMHQLEHCQKHPDLPLPISKPNAFLDQPEVDLLVSINLLSQLGCVSSKSLSAHRPPEQIQHFQQQLVEAHLAYLQKAPGHAALISDFAWSRIPTNGGPPQTWSLFEHLQWPVPSFEHHWNWNIAPAPERERDHHFVAHVCGFPDWKSACAALPADPHNLKFRSPTS